MIDIWKKDNIEFENFLLLDRKKHLMILEWRNHVDVRVNMRNQTIIDELEHFNFIESLKGNVDKQYWLVRRKGREVGVVYMNYEDIDQREMEFGMYLSPNYLGTGIGLEVGFEALHFFFNKFSIDFLNGYVKIENTENILIQRSLGFQEEQQGDMIKFIYSRVELQKLTKHFREFRKILIYGK